MAIIKKYKILDKKINKKVQSFINYLKYGLNNKKCMYKIQYNRIKNLIKSGVLKELDFYENIEKYDFYIRLDKNIY